jgi:hypothetical protein
VAQLAASCQRAADCTVGAGGHAARLRDLGAEVFAVDRDPAAIEQARTQLGEGGFIWRVGQFGDPVVIADVARFRPEFVLLDLGVSSGQLDLDERGFSLGPNRRRHPEPSIRRSAGGHFPSVRRRVTIPAPGDSHRRAPRTPAVSHQ